MSCTDRLCCNIRCLLPKLLSHESQLKGLSLVCSLICNSSNDLLMNRLPHSTHSYGSEPFSCTTSLCCLKCVTSFLQILHICLMPKCLILLCLHLALWLENILSHLWHLRRFLADTGWCKYECAFKSITLLPHSSQMCLIFESLFDVLCRFFDGFA